MNRETVIEIIVSAIEDYPENSHLGTDGLRKLAETKLDYYVEHHPATKEEELYEEMGKFLSVDDDGDYEKIVVALRKALKEDPGETLDFVAYDTKDGEEELIPVWDRVKFQFSVEEFCNLVGITKE